MFLSFCKKSNGADLLEFNQPIISSTFAITLELSALVSVFQMVAV
jgi:hypothetical protein